MLVPKLAAGGGLLFAFDHATIVGKLVLSLSAVASIFSWSIMITKLRVIRFARKQTRVSHRFSTGSATAASL
jgi:biopolymer transport protein ExbB/TolQ